MLEWYYLSNYFQTNNLTSSAGILNCLCQNKTDTFGAISTFNIEIFTEFSSEFGENTVVGGEVCFDWSKGKMLMTAFDLIITMIIIITDFILRIIVIFLVEWVDFKSLTTRLVIIQSLLFLSQYLNNGLSLMLVSFNIDQMVKMPVWFLDGDYPDFTGRWFEEISSFFITPMIANILISIIEFSLNYYLYSIICWHDRFFT